MGESARISDFFYKESKLKNIYMYIYFFFGGGGSEFSLQRIQILRFFFFFSGRGGLEVVKFFTKNPNLKKINSGGGGGLE